MAEASIIINVSNLEHFHGNGLSGMHRVPPKPANEKYGMYVVYPQPEIQDIGDQRKTVHWLKARPLAKDIVGLRSDSTSYVVGQMGGLEKWGVLLCEAEVDLTKNLIKAIEAEIEYLDENKPDVKYIRKGSLMVATNIEDKEIKDEKKRLSAAVVSARSSFEILCRKSISEAEVKLANQNMLAEYGRLVAEGDVLWADPNQHRDINHLHRHACRALGQERPWCYTPVQLFECPGCGAKLKYGVITCGSCQAILDREFEEYGTMTNREKAIALYPQRYAPNDNPNPDLLAR